MARRYAEESEESKAAAESAEVSSRNLLASIKTKTEESIALINTEKTGAVNAVQNEGEVQVAAVRNAFNTRLVNIKLSLTDEGLLHIEEVSA